MLEADARAECYHSAAGVLDELGRARQVLEALRGGLAAWARRVEEGSTSGRPAAGLEGKSFALVRVCCEGAVCSCLHVRCRAAMKIRGLTSHRRAGAKVLRVTSHRCPNHLHAHELCVSNLKASLALAAIFPAV